MLLVKQSYGVYVITYDGLISAADIVHRLAFSDRFSISCYIEITAWRYHTRTTTRSVWRTPERFYLSGVRHAHTDLVVLCSQGVETYKLGILHQLGCDTRNF